MFPVAVLLFAAILMLAAACGDGGQPSPTPPASTTTPTEGAAPEPAAPAAGKIPFTSFRDCCGEIYVMNADSSGLTRLTDNEPLD